MGDNVYRQRSGFRYSTAVGLKSGQFNRKRNCEKANPPKPDKYRIGMPPIFADRNLW
jgi:hypothetical protein